MINFTQLTEDQLLRQETLQAIKAEVFDLLDHLMIPESKKLADEIERKIDSLPNLKSRSPEIFALLQKLIIYLRINSLMAQDNNTTLNLAQNNFLDSFECGLDWNERMTGKMYSIPDLAWPNYAQQLLSSLKQNIQLLGNQPIVVLGDPQPSQPVIKNWLADYDRNLGPEKIDDLRREEYLAKNSNVKLLSETEKTKLRNVLKFYDNLKPIPIPAINQAFQRLGITEEDLSREFGAPEQIEELESFETPFAPSPTMPIPPAKTLSRPAGKDEYLEKIEEKPSSFSSSPQMRGGLRRGAENIISTPPPSSSEEGKIESQSRPTPPPQQPVRPPAPQQPVRPVASIHSPPARMPAPMPRPSQQSIRPSAPSQQNPPAGRPTGGPYLEPIDEPMPPSPSQLFKEKSGGQAKPDPRLEGNIIDLKNIDK